MPAIADRPSGISRLGREGGFTFIELMTVVAVLGVLAAIAIPVFLGMRERGWRGTVQSDLRNAAVAMETYFAVQERYPTDPEITLPASEGVTLIVEVPANPGDAGAFCITGAHDSLDGGAVVATYDSRAGGLTDNDTC